VTFSIAPGPTIVDASVAIELLEGDPVWAERFDSWLGGNRTLLAPHLFLAEIANGLLRGRRLTSEDTLMRLERAVGLEIEIADRGLVGVREAVALAERHRLTVYDALYLQLALDVDGDLATLDVDLRAAAEAEDIEVVG
jgi:predicted nucleic acid-binding protein